MNGLVVDGEPHIHVTLATPGGALEEGCTAYMRVFFAEVSGANLSHRRVRVNVPGMGEGEVVRLEFG